MEENNDFQSKIPDTPQQIKDVIELTPTVRQDISSSLQWGKFFAVAGIVLSAVLVISAFVTLFTGGSAEDEEEQVALLSSAASIISGIMYLIMAIIYCVVSVILLKAVTNLKSAMANGEQDKFAAGFHHLKTFSAVFGIITIIGMAVVLFSIFGLMFAACAASI